MNQSAWMIYSLHFRHSVCLLIFCVFYQFAFSASNIKTIVCCKKRSSFVQITAREEIQDSHQNRIKFLKKQYVMIVFQGCALNIRRLALSAVTIFSKVIPQKLVTSRTMITRTNKTQQASRMLSWKPNKKQKLEHHLLQKQEKCPSHFILKSKGFLLSQNNKHGAIPLGAHLVAAG